MILFVLFRLEQYSWLWLLEQFFDCQKVKGDILVICNIVVESYFKYLLFFLVSLLMFIFDLLICVGHRKEIKCRMWELCEVEKFGWWYNDDNDDDVFTLG